jgi:translation initiation factor IF-2
MGHIDHGKTTLLDYLRKSNVVAKEHGKITQNVSAYQVKYQAQNITFLDTPGHHIFAKMRYRSTKLTDIVVLVVSAEEGVKNQTKEIYQYLTSASLPIIIFLNKMDKRTANADKVLREFEQLGIITSE